MCEELHLKTRGRDLADGDQETAENQFPGEGIEKGYDSPEDKENDSDNTARDSQDPDALDEGSAATEESDFWSITGDCIMLHHKKPRNQELLCMVLMFLLSQFLLNAHIDVMRRTYTDIESAPAAEIDDYWCESGARELSGPWMVKTVFYILRPPAPPGYS